MQKNKFLLFRETVFSSFRKRITMGKCKTKSHSGIIRHVQAYSEASVTLEFLEPQYIENLTYSELKAYPEPWYIQNLFIFRALGYSNSEIYSETCQTSVMKRFGKTLSIFTKNFHKLFLQYISLLFSLLHETNTAWKVSNQIYFWSIFSFIQSKYRKMRARNNSVFGYFSRSEI